MQMPVRQLKTVRYFREINVFFFSIMFTLAFCFTSCSEIEKPQTEPFYAESKPPVKREFRWSNGKTPKTFDPARAAAAPETDFVRALFEGLTDIDARTLKEAPAVAEKWSSSEDFRVWTFQLRKDARWSNGKSVTANDFVISWKRLVTLGDKAAHRELFQNIVGMRTSNVAPVVEPTDFLQTPVVIPETNMTPTAVPSPLPANVASNPKKETKTVAVAKFGVEAIDETTLRVTLEQPDKDFPKLVANPIFRPVHGGGAGFETAPLDADIVTNGAFTIASISNDGITLDRSESYWNKSAVNLEHVRFVPKENTEAALDAYKKGELDAVTNAAFAPLALKLLTPYEDFRQTTHSALNFYEFNAINPPFDDRRIREALAISIDRDRLTRGELEGAARPALSFLPLGDKKNAKIGFDVARAKQLLEDAGFADSAGFPKIRLLINRNDTQQRVARAVARTWKQNLNLETEIIVKDLSEIEAARASGEYDLVRRGVVLPTVDEMAGMSAIFGIAETADTASEILPNEPEKNHGRSAGPFVQKSDEKETSELSETNENAESPFLEKNVIVTEEQAVFELNAIPLYFPMSYSLVKPYVKGFETNGLDAVSLRDVSIDSNWQPIRK